MSYYSDIYKERLARNSNLSGDRLTAGRERNFERFLKSSPHYVTFIHQDMEVEGVLEPYKQDETKTMTYLLCRVGEVFKAGDVVLIEGLYYMFYYWDERRDSGYNRWVLIKMNHVITWKNADGETYSSDAYIYSQRNSALRNDIKSRTRSATLYLENRKLDFLIMPSHNQLKVDSYLEITIDGRTRAERVVGVDFLSTPGVLYVSMDPTLKRDFSPMPEMTEEDDPNDFFWGGAVSD